VTQKNKMYRVSFRPISGNYIENVTYLMRSRPTNRLSLMNNLRTCTDVAMKESTPGMTTINLVVSNIKDTQRFRRMYLSGIKALKLAAMTDSSNFQKSL